MKLNKKQQLGCVYGFSDEDIKESKKAKLATQTLKQSYGRRDEKDFYLEGVVEKWFIVEDTMINLSSIIKEIKVEKGVYEKSLDYLDVLRDQDFFCETMEEAYDKFAKYCYDKGYSHVFNLKILDDKHGKITFKGDGYKSG